MACSLLPCKGLQFPSQPLLRGHRCPDCIACDCSTLHFGRRHTCGHRSVFHGSHRHHKWSTIYDVMNVCRETIIGGMTTTNTDIRGKHVTFC